MSEKSSVSSNDLLSAGQAAERLGVSVRRVEQFIEQGRLPAVKVGKNYIIQSSDLSLVENRKHGRPKKG